jgi:pyruvate dehydrogenase E2 component (dihydrolipoamide acetyltransferase)
MVESALTPIRKIIARRMQDGWNTPKVAFGVEIPTQYVSARMRKDRDRTLSPNLGLFDAILYSLAQVIPRHPHMNAALINERHITFSDVNIGFAVSAPSGLFAPVIRNANRLTLVEISKRRVELSKRVARGDVSPEVLSDGTFTVSNLGIFNVDHFQPILNPPQCAILGVGREKQRPFVVNGEIKAVYTTHLTLVVDHRLVDGAPAAAFFQDFSTNLQAQS